MAAPCCGRDVRGLRPPGRVAERSDRRCGVLAQAAGGPCISYPQANAQARLIQVATNKNGEVVVQGFIDPDAEFSSDILIAFSGKTFEAVFLVEPDENGFFSETISDAEPGETVSISLEPEDGSDVFEQALVTVPG